MSSYTHAVRVGKTWTPKPAFMASSLAPIKTRSGSLSSQSPILDQAIAKRRMPMLPVVVFGISIVAYTAQSELAQWVTAQGWRKPYLMMYVERRARMTSWFILTLAALSQVHHPLTILPSLSPGRHRPLGLTEYISQEAIRSPLETAQADPTSTAR